MKKKYLSPVAVTVDLYAEQPILSFSTEVNSETPVPGSSSYTQRRRGFGKVSPWEQEPEEE